MTRCHMVVSSTCLPLPGASLLMEHMRNQPDVGLGRCRYVEQLFPIVCCRLGICCIQVYLQSPQEMHKKLLDAICQYLLHETFKELYIPGCVVLHTSPLQRGECSFHVPRGILVSAILLCCCGLVVLGSCQQGGKPVLIKEHLLVGRFPERTNLLDFVSRRK